MSDRNLGALACALLLCACNSGDSGGSIGKADVGPVIGAGFSASLRADLAKATGIPAPVAAAPVAVAAAGAKPEAATAAAGAKPEAATAAAGAKPEAAVAAGTPATAAGTPATAAATPATAAVTPATGAAATADSSPAPVATGGAASLPAELAAVKLTLNEGWTRDAVGPGTFSFFAPGEGGKNIRFVFAYGYEDATAPTQREPYKQWLSTNKSITVNVDRQRGAAWFLEGTDAQNAAIFRYVITYGGRLLTCGGSLYKSGSAAGLRDLRDEIIMQAKRICESMDL